jgi:hypothetical protein
MHYKFQILINWNLFHENCFTSMKTFQSSTKTISPSWKHFQSFRNILSLLLELEKLQENYFTFIETFTIFMKIVQFFHWNFSRWSTQIVSVSWKLFKVSRKLFHLHKNFSKFQEYSFTFIRTFEVPRKLFHFRWNIQISWKLFDVHWNFSMFRKNCSTFIEHFRSPQKLFQFHGDFSKFSKTVSFSLELSMF